MLRKDVLERFFEALAAGDLAKVRACCTASARFWHSFDQTAHDLDAIEPQWQALACDFSEVRFADVRRQKTVSGYVQQHVMMVRRHDGRRIAWPACVVVRIKDGRISRLDEYIDRAGTFEILGEGKPMAPGLEDI
ncbi:nuclear transport factor 2 family protein [Novosphingobium malaysiense]|uniref:nuclear transport factor 2 family protein n=1 Tax=Novosphingobium malaysiense TaxID=1348853 RepID=UPI000691BC0D|nr:nuclear transport factor 2 family protein [Novosphingobium malaysiense]